MAHQWGEMGSRGHGSGDGTPAGVVSSRTCGVCGATQVRDSAVSDSHGRARPRRYYRDAWGYVIAERPDCLGYDPLGRKP